VIFVGWCWNASLSCDTKISTAAVTHIRGDCVVSVMNGESGVYVVVLNRAIFVWESFHIWHSQSRAQWIGSTVYVCLLYVWMKHWSTQKNKGIIVLKKLIKKPSDAMQLYALFSPVAQIVNPHQAYQVQQDGTSKTLKPMHHPKTLVLQLQDQ